MTTTASGTEAKRGRGRKRRKDAVQCPMCGHWGCPSEGGTYRQRRARIHYRRCGGCGHTFKTRTDDETGAVTIAV